MPAGAGTIPDVEDAIAATLETIAGLKVYDHEPATFDELPAVTLGIPRLVRKRIDEPENELGRFSWTLVWPLRLYVDWTNLGGSDGKTASIRLLGQVAGVLDANQHLEAGGQPLVAGIQDTKLETAEPRMWNEGDAGTRVLGGYEGELAVLLEVT